MKFPKALTLDLDDTLWPVAPTIRRAEMRANDWFRKHAPEVLQQFDNARRMKLRDSLVAEYPQRAHDLGWLRRQLFARMLDQSGHDATRASEVFELFMTARQEVELYPGVAEALARLAAQYPLAAVSNGNADIARIGLAPYFVFSLSASDYGAAKPDPGIYREACRRLGFTPDEVLHVGDDAHADVIGAHRAGLMTAWVNPQGFPWTAEVQPHVEVTDLVALASLLCATPTPPQTRD